MFFDASGCQASFGIGVKVSLSFAWLRYDKMSFGRYKLKFAQVWYFSCVAQCAEHTASFCLVVTQVGLGCRLWHIYDPVWKVVATSVLSSPLLYLLIRCLSSILCFGLGAFLRKNGSLIIWNFYLPPIGLT